MKLHTKVEGIEQILEPLISSLKDLTPEKIAIEDSEALYVLSRMSTEVNPTMVVIKFLESHYGVEDAKILLETCVPASYVKVSGTETSANLRNINSMIKEKLAAYSLNSYKELTSELETLCASTYLLTIGGYSVLILVTECPKQHL